MPPKIELVNDDRDRRASAAHRGPAIVTGPRSPLSGTPKRVAGSIRRTTSVDGEWTSTGLRLVASGRDLVSGEDGLPARIAEQTVTTETGADMTITSLDATPPAAGLDPLVGVALRSRLRRTLSTMPTPDDGRPNLVGTLLDEMVAAALISGYARQRTLDAEVPAGAFVDHMTDVCAGWGALAQMATTARSTGRVPLVIGPVAAPVTEPDDPLAWHALAAPAPGTVRRQRRTDIVPAADGLTARITAWFRDSHHEPDGTPSVLHEYSLSASVEMASGRLVSVQADPRVLPAAECPSAAASASLMTGEPLADLRRLVRQEMRGPGTCTHLNDMLRSLADVPGLLAWSSAVAA